jgi:carboxynorspermidine decarboxylase
LPAVVFPGEIYHLAVNPSSPWPQSADPLSAISDPLSSISNPQSPNTYRLGGPTCLAGDVLGDFTFPRKLRVGDILVFDDMAHYSMVKTTTFNGVKLPSIALQHEDGRLEILHDFTYADFRDRLA